MPLDKPNKDDALKRALRKLAEIRVVIEDLKDPDGDYVAEVEGHLEEIERILDA